ncbi:MAG: GNAT family N-acetyltransferase, partial [Deferrisomatales bacterium]
MTATLPTDHRLELRNLVPTDYPALREVMARAYPPEITPWTQEQFEAQLAAFPEGQICIEDRGRIAAVALSLIVDYAKHGDSHTYWGILGDVKFRNHDPDGDTLYGAEMVVDPDYRSLRLGRRLYDARKELCEKLNLKAIIIGGRIPGYADHADRINPREYVVMVRRKEIYDPVLTFQLGNDFHVRNVVKGYLPSDAESRSYAVVMEWNNIYYEERRRLIGGRKSYVRLGVVQWQMRPFQSFEDLMQQVEFFVDTVASYQGDLVLFPEFF